MKKIRIGHPLDPATEIGPLIHPAHVDKVLGFPEAARKEGARIACGGGRTETAAVYDPSRRELFTAVRGSGAHLNGQPLGVSSASRLIDALIVTGFPYNVHQDVGDIRAAGFDGVLNCVRDLVPVLHGDVRINFEVQIDVKPRSDFAYEQLLDVVRTVDAHGSRFDGR